MNNNNLRGSVLVLAAASLWSLSGLILRTAAASSTWVIFIRGVSAGVVLMPFILKHKLRPDKNYAITGALYFAFLTAFNVTTQMSSAALAVGMQSAAPVYVILIESVRRREFSVRKLPTLLLISAGVVMSVCDAGNTAAVTPIAFGFSIGLCLIAYSGMLKKIETTSSLGTLGIVNILTAGFSVLALPFDFRPVPSDFVTMLSLLVSGVFISGISYSLYGSGLKTITVERAMLIVLAEPILNPVWVYLGTGEIPSALMAAGLSFILMGVIADVLLMKHGSQ